MTTRKPNLLRGLTLLGLTALVLGGCVAQRQPMVVIEPEYSHVRHGDLPAAELMAVVGDELAVDLTVDEHGLLRPAELDGGVRLVRASGVSTGE